MNREVYLDHNATTPLCAEARAAMIDALEGVGNPSSIHAAGRRARDCVERSRAQVARLIGAAAEEVVFTSGGTESCQLALIREAGPVVTTRMEHPAVLGAISGRERFVSPGSHGRVDPDEVAGALPGARMCSIQWANHEVGNLNPIAEIARRCKAAGVAMHTDAVQAVGKVPVDVVGAGVDLLSLSAHKLGGPMGTGALYVRRGFALEPFTGGGHQERGRRPGTENVVGIAGMGAACDAALRELDQRSERVARLVGKLEGALRAMDARIHGDPEARVPGTVNFALAGVAGDALVQALDLEGIRASTGAACTSGSIAPSPVLLAMGVPGPAARGAVRLSLGATNTDQDIDRLVALLPVLIERIRKHDPVAV